MGQRHLDGTLELLGRADHQVKIRGLRVELGEIEASLKDHPSVREGVVVSHPGSGSEPRLVAYVVPVEAPGPSADGLRTFLQERLPEYMVPAFYISLDEMPLSATGKIDRQALPAPTGTGGAAADYVAPRGPIEEKMVDIWSQLLGIERVGVHDNFFRLGGHSLLGTVLMTRLRDTFQVDLPVVRLFEAPTVAALSAIIAPMADGSGSAEEIPRVERQEAVDLAVDDLSEDQVNALLGELLQNEEA
jgi:acyl carrier protein